MMELVARLRSSRFSRFSALVGILAATKVLAGLAAAIEGLALAKLRPSLLLYAAHVMAFGAAALWLRTSRHRDRAAQDLSVVFVLVASAFAEPLVLNWQDIPPVPRSALNVLLLLEPESWLSFFFGLFVLEFPKKRDAALPAFAQRYLVGCWILGLSLFVVNLLPATVQAAGIHSFLSLLLEPDRGERSYFWTVTMTAVLPVAVFANWKMRTSTPLERARGTFFISGLLLGIAPMVAQLVLQGWFPGYRDFTSAPAPARIRDLIIYPALLSIPITTAYAVLVHRVFDLRLIVRRAIQYALARYSVLTIATLPFVALAGYVYQHRDESVVALISGPGAPILFAAGLLGVVAYRFRQSMLNAIDRRFFREPYNAREIVAKLIDQARDVRTTESLASLASQEIDRALHVDSIGFLLLESSRHQFRAIDGTARPLDAASALAQLLQSQCVSIVVDPDDPDSLFTRLPREDREWISDAGYRLVVPVIGGKRQLLGIIAVGEKKSQLAYSAEDQNLLLDIASSAALAIENQLLRTSTPHRMANTSSLTLDTSNSEDVAFCCNQCFAVQDKGNAPCVNCGGTTNPANVPFIIAGKFQVKRKIGAGGMGVVYQALDLALRRPVAVKTLPRVSPEHALRLRQEARAVAAITHPNLATIFTAETWRGIPILIFEYLPAGTLSDRLRQGPLPIPAALAVGIALCDALNGIHQVGILHRDVKPSNIGFTADGTAKLLDFGLAKLLLEPFPDSDQSLGADPTHSPDATQRLRRGPGETSTAYMVGTPGYMSPETVRGNIADARCDLWSLAISLYEAITGFNPVLGTTLQDTLRRIRSVAIPDIREHVPDCSETLSDVQEEVLILR